MQVQLVATSAAGSRNFIGPITVVRERPCLWHLPQPVSGRDVRRRDAEVARGGQRASWCRLATTADRILRKKGPGLEVDDERTLRGHFVIELVPDSGTPEPWTRILVGRRLMS
ncbi:MAG TPA: hypothetical protein VFU41_06535 [Gemmatimonadales bacterium]|nr:hypothetical protein [Gemmatimonadales bacterium]